MWLVIVMGVCGSGKSSVGKALAEKLGAPFADADDWHSASNVAKMAREEPLTDQDRLPWLQDLHQLLHQWTLMGDKEQERQGKNGGESGEEMGREESGVELGRNDGGRGRRRSRDPSGVVGVLACSALRRCYRDILMGRGTGGDVSSWCVLVHLVGSEAVLTERVGRRADHFMPLSLLRSQMATLEPPSTEEGPHLTCSVLLGVPDIVSHICHFLASLPHLSPLTPHSSSHTHHI